MNMIVSSAPIAAAMSMGATASAVALPSATVGLDADLLALGRQFEAAWATEKAVTDSTATDLQCETAVEATSNLAHEIAKAQARTLDGLRVKVRALSWCYDGEDITLFEDDEEKDRTTDTRLADSILRDLLALT
jgi:hypothetical protein